MGHICPLVLQRFRLNDITIIRNDNKCRLKKNNLNSSRKNKFSTKFMKQYCIFNVLLAIQNS